MNGNVNEFVNREDEQEDDWSWRFSTSACFEVLHICLFWKQATDT